MAAGILALPVVSSLITWLQLLTASCHMLLGLSLFTQTLTRAGQSMTQLNADWKRDLNPDSHLIRSGSVEKRGRIPGT